MTVLLSSWDDILQFIVNLHNTGISWGAVITAIILWGKIMRNKRYHERDIRMENKIDAIMEKVGAECASLTVTESSTKSFRMSSISRSVVLSVVRIAERFTNYHITRRKNKMKPLFTNPWSKKLFAFLLLIAVNGLNDVLGLHLTPDTIGRITSLGGTYIVAQAGVDSIKPIILYMVGLIANKSAPTPAQPVQSDPNKFITG